MTAPRERPESAVWLAQARQDLEKAVAMREIGVFDPGDVCAYAQQAAEKALKAVLAAGPDPVPRMHDLLELRARAGIGVAPHITDEMLVAVSAQWTISRYPGDWAEPTDDDALTALCVAEGIVAAAKRIVTDQEPHT
jgi:HEPN domain-containing protein